VRGRKVWTLWWEESEIFWAVGGKCDILVCEESVILFDVGRKCDISGCETKVIYFGWWDESVYFVVGGK